VTHALRKSDRARFRGEAEGGGEESERVKAGPESVIRRCRYRFTLNLWEERETGNLPPRRDANLYSPYIYDLSPPLLLLPSAPLSSPIARVNSIAGRRALHSRR